VKNFFIGEDDFRIWLPNVLFIEKSEDAYNSRSLAGIMSTERRDRQGEILVSKGLDFDDFLKGGHFNDNHSQDTSAIVGYPEKVEFHNSLEHYGVRAPGWTCKGYVLKGTKRADGIWELAKALFEVPNRKLGFSVEGKVERREDKTIHKAKIRNVAVTNCPVNTDCTWTTLEKSFAEPDMAIKAMMAGAAVSPAAQSGGGALRAESLDSDVKKLIEDKKKKMKKALEKVLEFDDMLKSMDFVLEKRPEFSEEAAAYLVNHLFKNGGKL